MSDDPTDGPQIKIGREAIIEMLKDRINAEVSKSINVMLYGSPTDTRQWQYNGGIMPDEWKSKEALEEFFFNTKPEYITKKDVTL